MICPICSCSTGVGCRHTYQQMIDHCSLHGKPYPKKEGTAIGDMPRVTKAPTTIINIDEAYLNDLKKSVTDMHKALKESLRETTYVASLLERVKKMYPCVFSECIIEEDFKKLHAISEKYLTDIKPIRN